MREELLKAVAQPPKVLWAPMLPAILNMGVQFPLMFMAMGVGDVNPMFFVATILAGHMALIFAGLKEPHLSRMLQSYGQSYIKTTNLYPVRGSKFEP